MALFARPARGGLLAAAARTTETLRQLGRLHDDGVLTYAEFTAAKQRLLGLSGS